MNTNEQDLRREAIRRRLNGERRKDICRDLERSTQWFDKWWSIFDHDPHTDFSDRSRAPLVVDKTSAEIEQLVVEVLGDVAGVRPGHSTEPSGIVHDRTSDEVSRDSRNGDRAPKTRLKP